jgi:ribosomal-protein-alanine N-acetyltransferase
VGAIPVKPPLRAARRRVGTDTLDGIMSFTLVPFTVDRAALVAGWVQSADEADKWCSRAEHPFPAEVVAGWSTQDDVAAYLLLDGGRPVGYGEVWADDEEDEAELARLLVAPGERGRGVGKALAAALAGRAGFDDVFMRVRPDNAVALAAYRDAGFADVAQELQDEWNAPQPRPYTWLRFTG